MKKSVLIQPLLKPNYGRVRIVYETNPYKVAEGASRAMQKFAVIALTTKGSDPLRPWFGTRLGELPRMNIYDNTETELFIKEQVLDAINQFFILQDKDRDTLVKADLINAIDLTNITIYNRNQVTIEIMFYPVSAEAVSMSLEV